MNEKEIREFDEYLQRRIQEIKTSKKEARESLIRLGVLTKKGKLRKRRMPTGPIYGPGPTYDSLSAYKKKKLKKELKNKFSDKL